MVDLKEKYLKQFKDLHYRKTGVHLSDELALEYFEKLVVLVGTITSHLSPRDVIISSHGGRKGK